MDFFVFSFLKSGLALCESFGDGVVLFLLRKRIYNVPAQSSSVFSKVVIYRVAVKSRTVAKDL